VSPYEQGESCCLSLGRFVWRSNLLPTAHDLFRCLWIARSWVGLKASLQTMVADGFPSGPRSLKPGVPFASALLLV
jgi:hypothetical protein